MATSKLVGAHHIIKIFYGVRNDIDVYAGRLVAVFGQHLRHTAFAHGVGDAHPDVRHADAAVLDGLAGVAGVFYQNLAFRRQAQLFFILIKYMNAELLLQLAHMMADSGLCERKPLCRPCVTARTDDLQEGLYLRIKHRFGTLDRSGRSRSLKWYGYGTLGNSRLDDFDSGVGIRSFLHKKHGIYHAGISGTPLQSPITYNLVGYLFG